MPLPADNIRKFACQLSFNNHSQFRHFIYFVVSNVHLHETYFVVDQ